MAALGSISTKVRFIGLKAAQTDFATAGKRMRAETRKNMETLGRRMSQDVKGEMPRTLGVVSGDTKAGINF